MAPRAVDPLRERCCARTADRGEREFLGSSLRAYEDYLRAAARTTRRLRVLIASLCALLVLTSVPGSAVRGRRESHRRGFR
ncbi:hypothetical protein GCM10010232_67940 [Streptomyces amakusaensis]